MKLSPKNQAVYDYLCREAKTGQPLRIEQAQDELALHNCSVRTILYYLRDQGLLQVEGHYNRGNKTMDFKITVNATGDVMPFRYPYNHIVTDILSETLDAIRALQVGGQKVTIGALARKLRISSPTVQGRVVTLVTKRLVATEKNGSGKLVNIRILVPGEAPPAKDESAELAARREAVERERAERRRALLANERKPGERVRSAEDFMDAATIAALSGGTMRSLRGMV